MFQRIADHDQGAAPNADVLNEAVRAALGLTAAEAMRVFRKACRSAGGLNDEAVEVIVREKRRALRRTPATLAGVAGTRWLRPP